ncbi:hypothetical protein M1494_02835, partial [Candidatus Parvarchaeota archaeon]|nr:hypothetical protein [Candidatus Parvarchaeota archaeon]
MNKSTFVALVVILIITSILGLEFYFIPILTNSSNYFTYTPSILQYSETANQNISVPSGILNYQVLSINNSESSATPSPFQQIVNLTINSSNSGHINMTGKYAFQNVEFFNSTNGKIIDSWLEGHTSKYAIFFIKLPNGIAANTVLNDVAVGYASNGTNLFNNVSTGEAPQLSAKYAEYDDGANVFINYWNFNGTSMPKGWDSLIEIYIHLGVVNGGSVTVNNGVSLQANDRDESSFVYINFNKTNITNQIIDAYTYENNSEIGGVAMGWVSGIPSTSTEDEINSVSSLLYNGYAGYSQNDETTGIYYADSSTSSNLLASPQNFKLPGVYSFYWFNGKQHFWSNYKSELNSSNSSLISASNESLYLGGDWYNASTPSYNDTTYQWVDTRAYPPNGIMPKVSLSNIYSVPVSIFLYLNSIKDSNSTIKYGEESNFTASISNIYDYISLYVNGTKMVSFTKGSITYLKNLSAGLYKVTIYSNSSGVSNVTYYERISKATPTLTITTTPTQNYTQNGTSLVFHFSISTINNQLSGSFYINGTLKNSSITTSG